MEVYVLITYTSKGPETNGYSSKSKLLKGYIEIYKNYYSKCGNDTDNYKRVIRGIVYQLTKSVYYRDMPEDHKQDLINFFQEKEYQGIFTFDELKSVDIMFEFYTVKLDDTVIEQYD